MDLAKCVLVLVVAVIIVVVLCHRMPLPARMFKSADSLKYDQAL